MDSDSTDGSDATFSVYHENGAPENFIESIEVNLESGYHAREVSLEDGSEESYKTNFLSEIINVTDSEKYITNFANEIENVDSELYRTSFESDYLYDYREIDRSDNNSDDDSLDADYYEEIKTMENLIEQNSDLYMTNFNHVETVSPGYKEFSLDEIPSHFPKTMFTNSETKTVSDIEESLTTEMTFFEDQTTHGFRVNNSFGLKEGERSPTTADTTSGELDLTEFDEINSTFASDRAKMDIEMSQRKASISKSEMTFVNPQNNSIAQTKSQANTSVSTSLKTTTATTISTINTRPTSTSTIITLATSSTAPTIPPATTTTPTITPSTTTQSTTTFSTTTRSITTLSTTSIPSTTTTTTIPPTTTTTTIPPTTTTTPITAQPSTTTASTATTTLLITSIGSLKTTYSGTDIMPRKMPLVDNKRPDEFYQDADTDDNSVLIPLGHGLYTKFVLNKDTKLDFNFLSFI